MAGAATAAILQIFGANIYRTLPVVPAITGKSCRSTAEMSDFTEKSA